MARIRCTARKSVIPFLPSHLAERPQRRTMPDQFSHLERLHRRLHDEQEHQCHKKEQEQQGSSPLPQQEVESDRPPSPAPQPEMPLHYLRASRLLEVTLTETETTMLVAVRATAWSFRRSRSRMDGSLDPSLVTLLAGVTSTTLSIPCCVRPLTDTLGLSSTVV
jgi:hypothetical protein